MGTDAHADDTGLLTAADGVFEGGGVKGLAFAGAIAAAEEAGVERWVNVAGTSAGAIVAALLAAGYDATQLRQILDTTPYPKFADYGPGGKWIGGAWNAVRIRGLARGDFFREWLGERLEESPLKRRDPTFADVARDDLPTELSAAERAQARFRLRVIASDISAGRMLVLPDDIEDYEDADGNPLTSEGLGLVEAVRMSMSFPFFFSPVTLYRRDAEGGRRPHLIVDGGLLSNFPVWLFDSPGDVRRPTWGFRLHRGSEAAQPPYREIPRLLWPLPMAKAMFFAATEAWDQRLSATSEVRTVSIPTGEVPTLDFELSEAQRDELYRSGLDASRSFFGEHREYLNSFGKKAVPAAG